MERAKKRTVSHLSLHFFPTALSPQHGPLSHMGYGFNTHKKRHTTRRVRLFEAEQLHIELDSHRTKISTPGYNTGRDADTYDQRGVGRNDRGTSATHTTAVSANTRRVPIAGMPNNLHPLSSGSVCVVGGANELRPLPLRHLRNAFVPASNDFALPQTEPERLIAIPRTVKLLPIRQLSPAFIS